MKALLFTFGILIWLPVYVNGQQPGPVPKLSFEYEKECGSPVVESMLWISIEGTVVKLIDGDSLKLLTNSGEKKIVKLVAIDVSRANKAGRNLLSQLVLNRKVEVLVNPSNDKPRTWLVSFMSMRRMSTVSC